MGPTMQNDMMGFKCFGNSIRGNIVNKLELPVIWLVAPKSMNHMEEDERKHVLVLPDSMSVVMEVDADLSDF